MYDTCKVCGGTFKHDELSRDGQVCYDCSLQSGNGAVQSKVDWLDSQATTKDGARCWSF
jgi:hypothetical protein